MLMGHWLEHVWQPTQTQMVLQERTSAQAELDQPKHLVGGIVHGLDKGAAVGAAPTLVTAAEAGAAALIDLNGQECLGLSASTISGRAIS